MSKERTKAIIYARQSSGKEDGSESIETQIQNCQRYCAEHNYDVIAVFQDANTSGRTYPADAEMLAKQDFVFEEWFRHQSRSRKFRRGLECALKCLSNGYVLVADDTTRVYRGLAGGFLEAHIHQRLQIKNAVLETVKSGGYDPNSFDDVLISNVQNNINDRQLKLSRKKSIEVRKSMRDKGIWPAGIRVVGLQYLHSHQYRVKDEYRACIGEIFQGVISYRTYSSIIREMNRKYGHLFGKAFYESNFYHITAQPLYCGHMYNTQGELIKCHGLVGEPAVSKETFLKAREILEKKRRDPVKGVRGVVRPFSRKLVCGYCGAKMVIAIDRGGVVSYHCNAGCNLRRNDDCPKARVNINFHRGNITGLHHAVSPLLILAQYRQCLEAAGIASFQKKLEETRDRLDSLHSKENLIHENFLSDVVSSASYEEVMMKIRSRRKELENTLQLCEASLNTNHKRKMLDDPFWGKFDLLVGDKLPAGQYKELLDNSVRCIRCFAEYVEIETFYGTFRLDRQTGSRFRHFPAFSWRVLTENHEQPIDISKCCFEVIYKYNDSREKRLLIKLPVLEICEQGVSETR